MYITQNSIRICFQSRKWPVQSDSAERHNPRPEKPMSTWHVCLEAAGGPVDSSDTETIVRVKHTISVSHELIPFVSKVRVALFSLLPPAQKN